MKKLVVLLMALSLTGCAQWKELSDQEKTAYIVAGAILFGANIVKNSNDTVINNNCISTRSIKTGCEDIFVP